MLKRLDDAERDGDRIYAVIKGIGAASDGARTGYRPATGRAAPGAAARLRQGGDLPATVGLVEAHGTGTVVGDRTELESLTQVFKQDGRDPADARSAR